MNGYLHGRLISEWIGPRQGLGIGGGVCAPSFPLGLINMSLSTLLGKKKRHRFPHVLMTCDDLKGSLEVERCDILLMGMHPRPLAALRICLGGIEGLPLLDGNRGTSLNLVQSIDMTYL